VLSAAWQRHVHDHHLALKKARYLSLKITKLPLAARVQKTGVNRAPEWKDGFDHATQERPLHA